MELFLRQRGRQLTVIMQGAIIMVLEGVDILLVLKALSVAELDSPVVQFFKC